MDEKEEKLVKIINLISKNFDDELFRKTEDELESYWHFEWDSTKTLEEQIYIFHERLALYGRFCRRWEEKTNGSLSVVGRVRDKYLMPKISAFTKQIRQSILNDLNCFTYDE